MFTIFTSIIMALMLVSLRAQRTPDNYNYVTSRPRYSLNPTFSNLNVQQSYDAPSSYMTNNPIQIWPYVIGQNPTYPYYNNYNYNDNINGPIYPYTRPTLQTYGSANTYFPWQPWYTYQYQRGKK